MQPERSYDRDHIVVRLMAHLLIDANRAELGFQKMHEAGVLSPTLEFPPKFYLGDSTPF